MPAGAVYVGRPGKWGNPFTIGAPHPVHGWPMSAAETVELYREKLTHGVWHRDVRERLGGKDLACWCPLDQPCHADALLEFANPSDDSRPGDEHTPTETTP